MTTSSPSSPQPSQSTDFGARTIVAAGGALAMVVLAVIVYAVTGMWLPTLIIVLLIPIHVALTITDTNILEEPATAPARAWGELQKLPARRTSQADAPRSGLGAPPVSSGPWVGPASPGSSADMAPKASPTAPYAPPPATTPTPPTTPVHGSPEPYGQQPPTPYAEQSSTPAPATPGTAPAQPSPSAAAPARPVPIGPGLSFDPPGPPGPSVIHGFGSYGGRPTTGSEPAHPQAVPSAEDSGPVATPSTEDAPAQTGLFDGDDFDDPDLTVQRPPRA